jgi:phage shock protein A
MGIIRDLYNQGEKNLNELKKKYQNPLWEFENEIDNLKLLLKESKSLAAHINALKIRAEKDVLDYKSMAVKNKRKAENTINELREGRLTEETAKKISINFLKLKHAYENRILELNEKIPIYDEEIIQVKEKIEDLKEKIAHYEKEYLLLKNNRLNKNENELFYDDSAIISRLETLKANIIKKKEIPDLSNADSIIENENTKMEDIYKEYEELKNKI